MFTNAELRDMQSFIGKIGQLRYANRTPVTGWTAVRGEYRGAGDTVIDESSSRPIEPGTAWSEETLYFRARVTVGSEFDGQDVYLQFQNDGECLLYVNGIPAEGLDLNHTFYMLGTGAGQTFELSVESANRWQNRAHAVQSGVDYPMQVFRRADLLTTRPQVERLYTILYCLTETADDFAQQWMLRARREINPNAPPDAFLKQADAYLRAIGPALAPKDKPFTVWTAGHSHLDLGYLWPIKETVRKLGRTFANMLYLLDRYPEFRFTQSQAVLFEWAKEYYPELYARVKEYVKQGRFELVGGLYVEADANMVSAESYIRQFLYGMEIFEREFGVTPKIGWLPDTFGLSGILPQIYKKCGMVSFYSAKLRSNQHYQFPHTLYEWEGIDGSRITATLDAHGTYNGDMTAAQIREGLKTGAQPSAGNAQFYSVGHGDGGGGVTQEMLDRARVYDALPSLPAIRWGTAQGFFDRVASEATEQPVWRGECYYDLHQGTLTSQACLKRYNRFGEAALLAAEILGVMAGARDEEELRRLWKLFLFNQFHDILPGSCQKSVVDAACAEYEKVLSGAGQIIRRGIAAIADRREDGAVTVFNPLCFARGGYVEVDAETLYACDIPPMGYKVVRLAEAKGSGESLASEDAASIMLENEHLRAVISKINGELISLYSKKARREALRGAGNRFLLYDEGVLKNKAD